MPLPLWSTLRSGRSVLGYNTKPKKAVIDANPNANIDVLNFEATQGVQQIHGKLYLYADKDAKIYKLTSKGVEGRSMRNMMRTMRPS
jgi:hypothetical protein